MSYLAIARKWRPQRFEDLVGQGHVARTLQNAIRGGRVHHAFLFTGARGVGKTSAARILAKALQCERGPGDNPCNACASCREVTAGSHPDVVEIDAASNNRIDDIRDLVEKVRFAPARGRYRIYIVDEVHMVTPQAFNALLKTLEEPPAHVVFVFATTDPQKILDTVLSRCQRFDFKMIPVRILHERLRLICQQEGVVITDGGLLLIAREAGGSMRDAQSLLDQVISYGEGALTEEQVVQILGFIDRTLLHEVLRAVVEGDAGRALAALQTVQEYGYDAVQFARELLEALRHLMVTALVADAGRLVDLPEEEQQRLKEMAAHTTPEAIQRRFDTLAGGMNDIVRSESPALMLEMAVARIARIRPYVPVDTLVERLVALERRLGAGGGPGPSSGSGRPWPPSSGSRPTPPASSPSRFAPAAVPAHSPAAAPAPVPGSGSTPAPSVAPVVSPAASPDPAPALGPVAPARPTPAPAPVRPVAAPAADPPVPAVPRAPPVAEAPGPPADAACDPERWRSFLAHLRKHDPLKCAVFSEGALVSASGNTISVALSGAWLSRGRAYAADPKLRDLAAEWFGAPVVLDVVDMSQGPAPAVLSPAEEARRERRAREDDVRARAARHPAIEAFQHVFPGTRVEETVPLDPGAPEGA